MCAAGRLKPADFYEKSPVFSQKHGGFLWKVGDLNRSDVEAAVIGDSGKSKKPNCSPLEVAVCGVNGEWGAKLEFFRRAVVALRLSLGAYPSVPVRAATKAVVGGSSVAGGAGKQASAEPKNGSLRGETAVRERALRRFAGRCAADGFISFQKRE